MFIFLSPAMQGGWWLKEITGSRWNLTRHLCALCTIAHAMFFVPQLNVHQLYRKRNFYLALKNVLFILQVLKAYTCYIYNPFVFLFKLIKKSLTTHRFFFKSSTSLFLPLFINILLHRIWFNKYYSWLPKRCLGIWKIIGTYLIYK